MSIKRPKLQDIANIVGVTKMTVSRYFNDPKSVAQKTRDKISAVIDESGFIPNKVPAIMSKSSSRSIGLIIPSFSNLVFSDVIDAVEKTAADAGYSVLLMHSSYDINIEEQRVASLISYQVDGIILSEPEHTPLTTKRLLKSQIPVAEIMSIPENPINVAIGINHKLVTYEATKALIESGRRNIAYFGVRLDRRTIDRQKGYMEALSEANLPVHLYQAPVHSTFSVGREHLSQALDDKANLDAIICTNDDVAVGVLIACQHHGIKVPEDLCVLGYNGLSFCDAAIPKLCSIGTPRYEIGRKSVEAILHQLSRDKLTPNVEYAHCVLTQGGSLLENEAKKIDEAIRKA